jgi:hypothetical protein
VEIKPISILFLLFFTFISSLNAQVEKKKLPDMYIGFSGGINFTQSVTNESFGIPSIIDNSGTNNYKKDYQSLFSNFGNQFHFEIWYPLSNIFHIGLCPGIGTYQYNYKTSAQWTDGLTAVSTVQEVKHNQKLRYFEIPVIFRYVLRFEKISPFLQIGGSYNILMNAQKQAQSTITQKSTNTEYNLNSTSIGGDVSSSFIKSKFTVLGGIGAFFDIKIAVISLDVSYHLGLNNITNEKNRYSNPTFSGAYNDVQDNIVLNHIVFNLSVLFPLNSIKRRGAVECIYFDNKKKK